jgi:hypothetical protein
MITFSNVVVYTRTGERNLKLLPSMLFATAAVCLLTAGSALAAVEAPNPKDLTQGKWELQVAKSKFCKEAPKQSSREIVDAGWGLLVTHWTGVDSKGAPVDIRYVLRYDGQKYPADIKPVDVAISWKLVSPRQVEFVDWSKDNKAIAQNVRTISDDGQTMTQKTKYTGQACEDVQVFERR